MKWEKRQKNGLGFRTYLKQSTNEQIEFAARKVKNDDLTMGKESNWVRLPSNENPHSSFRYISTLSKRSSQSCGVTAPFSNMRTLKFKSQPTNAFSSQSCSVNKDISLCISWRWRFQSPRIPSQSHILSNFALVQGITCAKTSYIFSVFVRCD